MQVPWAGRLGRVDEDGSPFEPIGSHGSSEVVVGVGCVRLWVCMYYICGNARDDGGGWRGVVEEVERATTQPLPATRHKNAWRSLIVPFLTRGGAERKKGEEETEGRDLLMKGSKGIR